MKNLPTIAVLAILPLLFSACCSDVRPRFWEVRDTKGGGKAYAVDTAAVPLESFKPGAVRYVSPAGELVSIASPKVVRGLSEQEWKAATSGARYSLLYCGKCKACWAKAKGR